MKYVQINSRGDRWAESIIFSKHRDLIANGDDSWVFWARGSHEQDEHMQKIASLPEVCLDGALTRLDGKAGFHSKGITRKLLDRLNEIDPDVVHLHVLSNYYVNVEVLFNWLATHRCHVIWTQHDCWAFTGHCIYFTAVKCDQWKTGCAKCAACPQKEEYPETFAGDSSVRWCFERKKRLFTMLPTDRMELITPSQWLADLIADSFLSKYSVHVVHNKVNTDIFKPTPSDFRERYGLQNKFIVLGVASKWNERKGLDDFMKLAGELDNRSAIVLVGLTKRQMDGLPSNVIALEKTNSQKELAALYSTADVFFNPTQEDNYPTVNLEAEACETDVLTYDTGGCRETIHRPGSFLATNYLDSVEKMKLLIASHDNFY